MRQAYPQIMPFYNLISKSKLKKTRHPAVSYMTTIIQTLNVFAISMQYKRKTCPQWPIPRKILMKISLIELMLWNRWFSAMWKLKCMLEMKRIPPWFNGEILHTLDMKDNIRKKFKLNQSELFCNKFKELRTGVKHISANARRSFFYFPTNRSIWN